MLPPGLLFILPMFYFVFETRSQLVEGPPQTTLEQTVAEGDPRLLVLLPVFP